MSRRIGLFLMNLDNDFQQRLRDDALAAAARVRYEVDVFSAHSDPAKQGEQIEQFLKGPAKAELLAILVSPVREDTLADMARGAAAAGVGWVILNREAPYLSALRDEFPALPIFGVSPDQVGIGRIQGQQMKRLLPDGGRVVYVTGLQKTSSAQRRLQGVQEEVAGSTIALTILESDWSSEGARIEIARWLGTPDGKANVPGLFSAQNDAMALGIRQALRDAASSGSMPGLAQVPITGCDGSPDFGQRLVREKRIRATVALPSVSGPALEWVARMVGGKERADLRVTLPVQSFPELSRLTPGKV